MKYQLPILLYETSSKSNFSAYSYFKRFAYESTARIMPIQNIYRITLHYITDFLRWPK